MTNDDADSCVARSAWALRRALRARMAIRAVRGAFPGSQGHRQDACATSIFAGSFPESEGSRTAQSAVLFVAFVPFVPFASAALFLLALALVSAQCRAADATAYADGAPPIEKIQSAEARIAFPPDTEAKFGELLKRMNQEIRELWTLRMKDHIAKLAKATGLTAEGAAILEIASKAAIERSLIGRTSNFDKKFRADFSESPLIVVARINDAVTHYKNYSYEDVADYEEPADDPEWNEVVRRTLTPEQTTTWVKFLDDRKLARVKEREEYLMPIANVMSGQFRRSALAQCAYIQRTLALPADRTAAMEVLATDAVQEGTERWIRRAEKAFALLNAEQRKQVKKGQFSIGGARPLDRPEQQAVWKEGLAKILTTEQMQHLTSAKRERRARRIHALGRMMVAEMDERVAFTASQRERLQPIAERLVDAPAFFPELQSDDQSVDFEAATFFAAALAAPEKEMGAILDPTQWKHWRETCDPKGGETQQTSSRTTSGAPKETGKSALAELEPEDFESALSDFLYETAASVRERTLGALELRMEEGARLADLGSEPIRRLQIAARGASEESLRVWKIKVNEEVRGQLADVTAAAVKQKLSTVQKKALEQITTVPAETQPIWLKAVEAEMNSEQRATWQKEIDERSAFKFISIASLILAEFDRKVSVSAEQWDKLEPMIAATVHDSSADVAYMYSEMSPKWYLDCRAMFVPVAGIPEKEMRAVLPKEQWDRWRRTSECASAMEDWRYIPEMREQRLKEKK